MRFPPRQRRSIATLLVCACVLLASAGCASRLLGRGPAAATQPSEPTAAATRSEKAEKRAARRAEKQAARLAEKRTAQQVDKKSAQRVEKKAARADKQAARADKKAAQRAANSNNPLEEARVRAEAEPAEPWWPYRVATLEAQAGRRESSEASLRAALARDPAYAPALTRLSQVLYEQGRHAEAVQLLTPVREGGVTLSDSDRPAVLSGLALHQVALGRDDQARAAMGLLARGDRDDAAGVAAYLAVRDTSEAQALRLTEAALREAPKSAANHNNRGIALLRAADPDAAERAFQRAIELDPARPGPYYNLAILERFYRLDTAAATRHFQQYWRYSHADPDSLFAELGRGRPAPVAEEGDAR